MSIRPRTKLKLQRKARRCRKCNALLAKHIVRCKRCAQPA